MFPWWIVSLRPGVVLEENRSSDVIFRGPSTRISIRSPSLGAAAALRRLAGPGASVGELLDSVLRTGGSPAAAQFCDWLRQLTSRKFLRVSVASNGQMLASLELLTARFVWPAEGHAPNRPVVLSRFACLRRVRDVVVLESPLSQARVLLHDPRVAAWVADLPAHASAGRSAWGLPSAASAEVAGLLWVAGMLTELHDNGFTEEDQQPTMQTWEFHDLLFHTRSREGRHDAPLGAVYPFVGYLPPPPALKPVVSGEAIDLHRPDLDQLRQNDLPLADVVEQRRSIREYAQQPLTAVQLGEFLYRAARARRCYDMEVSTPLGPVSMEFTSRPYPAGGALYELELYVVVQRCSGLTPGLYHYDPLQHRLQPVAGATPDVMQLIINAGGSSGIAPESVQVLLVVASRFQRVAWKYAAMAYALTLKHVGVLYQTMYLAATAMNLAPCALGAGDSDLFARATGIDYYSETSVGEFLLGSDPRT